MKVIEFLEQEGYDHLMQERKDYCLQTTIQALEDIIKLSETKKEFEGTELEGEYNKMFSKLAEAIQLTKSYSYLLDYKITNKAKALIKLTQIRGDIEFSNILYTEGKYPSLIASMNYPSTDDSDEELELCLHNSGILVEHSRTGDKSLQNQGYLNVAQLISNRAIKKLIETTGNLINKTNELIETNKELSLGSSEIANRANKIANIALGVSIALGLLSLLTALVSIIYSYKSFKISDESFIADNESTLILKNSIDGVLKELESIETESINNNLKNLIEIESRGRSSVSR